MVHGRLCYKGSSSAGSSTSPRFAVWRLRRGTLAPYACGEETTCVVYAWGDPQLR